MSISPYATVGPTLVDNGYSAIPIKPGSKLPGEMEHKKWYGLLHWAQFCDRLPTRHELSVWNRWPDGGVCVACGYNGLIAIDIDTEEDAVVEAIMEVLPHSPVAKKGAKGQTLFYRGSANIKSRPFNVAGGRALDLLAHGRQTVLPPTIHPQTEQPYTWITPDTLIDTPPEKLPQLPDDISDRLEEALVPFGLVALPAPRGSGDGASHTGCGDNVWRDINEQALADLDKWVPQLGLAKTRAHRDGYRAVAEWRSSSTGRPISARSPNLSFNEKGIKDMGEDRSYTAIDVVMEARGLDVFSASDWLAERIGYEPPVPDESTAAIIRSAEAKRAAVEIAEEATSVVPKKALDAPRGKVDPFIPRNAGGLIQKIAEFTLASYQKPVQEFAMLAAVGFMAALSGRRYVGPTNLGLNVYLIGLSPPSFGKEHPQKMVKSLAAGAGRLSLIGASKQTSDGAIEQLARKSPSAIMVMDELGVMLQSMTNPRASAHADTLRGALLEVYGKSDIGNIWFPKQTADPNKDTSPVHMPTLSVLGFSTATEFYKGLPASSLTDGFAARLLTIYANERGARQRISPEMHEVPEQLVRAIQASVDAWPAESNMAPTAYATASMKPPVHMVRWADEAAQLAWEEVDDWQEAETREDPARHGIVGRAAAHTQKLAALRAISYNPANPRITTEDVAWGYAFVQHALDCLDDGVRKYVVDSPYEQLCKSIMEALGRADPKGLPYSQLGNRRGISKVKDSDRKAAVEDLVQRGLVLRSGKRGQTLVLIEQEENDSEIEKLAA